MNTEHCWKCNSLKSFCTCFDPPRFNPYVVEPIPFNDDGPVCGIPKVEPKPFVPLCNPMVPRPIEEVINPYMPRSFDPPKIEPIPLRDRGPVCGIPKVEPKPFMPLVNPMVPSKPVALICNQQLPPALFKD